MRGRDEDTGEYLAPSRSQQRRDALDVLELVQRLSECTPTQLAKLPMPEAVLPHFEDLRRMSSYGARKRQLAFVAKQMRREEEDTLAALRDALEAGGEAARQETALLHRAEGWRERLLAETDVALPEWFDAFPGTDRQQLRQLIRNTLDERAKNKPPRAYRELFRLLRDTLAGAAEGDPVADADLGDVDAADIDDH